MDALKRYMKSDPEHLLSVLRATMGIPKGPALDVRIKCESAVIPPLRADGDGAPEVDGMPLGESFDLEEKTSVFSELTRRPGTFHAAALEDPLRCTTYVHTRTLVPYQ